MSTHNFVNAVQYRGNILNKVARLRFSEDSALREEFRESGLNLNGNYKIVAADLEGMHEPPSIYQAVEWPPKNDKPTKKKLMLCLRDERSWNEVWVDQNDLEIQVSNQQPEASP